MILSSIFAVAIGLLILWIVLSFATIQIQEWVSTRLSKRARIEADAIHQMFAIQISKRSSMITQLSEGRLQKRVGDHPKYNLGCIIFLLFVALSGKKEISILYTCPAICSSLVRYCNDRWYGVLPNSTGYL